MSTASSPIGASREVHPPKPAPESTSNVHTLSPQIYRFGFTGAGSDFAVIMLKNALLSILTLGIYHFYGKVHSRRFLWQSMHFAGARFVYTGNAAELIKARLMLVAMMMGVFAVAGALGAAGLGPFVGIVVFAGLSLMGPWLTISMIRFRLSRTTWRGLKLGMLNVTSNYIKVWFKGWALTILTLGYYGSWWSNDTWATIVNAVRLGSLQMRYTGRGEDLKWTFIKGYILSFLTLGLYAPWFIADVMRYRAKHTWLGNQTDGFARSHISISGGEIFSQFFMQYLLLIFTLGLAMPWVITSSLRWFAGRLTFHGAINFAAVLQQQTEKRAGAFGDGIGDALDVGFG
jgi:uncharacterized membrane protein YjgN (DUF898 family)